MYHKILPLIRPPSPLKKRGVPLNIQKDKIKHKFILFRDGTFREHDKIFFFLIRYLQKKIKNILFSELRRHVP